MTDYYSRQKITIESIGNIRLEENGRIHMYLVGENADDITHEIQLTENGTKMFLEMIKQEMNLRKQGFSFWKGKNNG